ncbi:hypothetical protein [Caulobacter sp. 17J80-11]|uniref:hypothetical protein n=1 Tax=Caulobacter sp. 17J80-11 TaxID=2763502 RepID=UPI001653CADA|nr:hypothetical protein [Caulobacter sp. 17J80-11]MBC6980261.1 hypothetical protein [Caulobacter sp. 17J80-11]
MFLATPVLAQPSGKGTWEAESGDFVEVHNGTYSLAVSEQGDGGSVFSEGKVVDRKPTADGGLELTLKPNTIGGASRAEYATMVLVISPDGAQAELFTVHGGARHSVIRLATKP